MLELKEIVELQKSYKKLFKNKVLTKHSLCELIQPFRDKYKLSDIEVLSLVRDELSLEEIVKLIDKVNK